MKKETFDPFRPIEKETPPTPYDPFEGPASSGEAQEQPPQGWDQNQPRAEQTPPLETPPLEAPPLETPPLGGYYGPEFFGPPAPLPPEGPKTGMAVTSLVMGILSILCCYGLGCFNLVFSILAIVFSLVAPKNEYGKRQSIALAGLACGIVGAALGLGYIAIVFIDAITQPYYY